MMEVPRILSVIGLGKLGAPMAACLAAKGFEVIGVDVDPHKVDAVNRQEAPVYEPGLAELLRSHGERLRATTNLEAAVAQSDATFIVVPTPSEPDGSFSLRYIVQACDGIAKALRQKETWHLVVVTSTISPLSMDTVIKPYLEEHSGKRCGKEFGLCYSPEFIALGSVIHDFLNPDFILIGESDQKSGEVLATIYKQVCDNDPPVARMNFVNAELTKLAVNTFVTTKISFANMLARICERLPGADVDVVTQALGLDSRIGRKYLKGAVSYGGPCFPRDNLALIALARQIGAPADIAETTDRFNRWQVQWLADVVQRHLGDSGVVGILGLTYKPNTDVVDESVGILLAEELASRGISVVAYDPAGNGNAKRILGERVQFAETAQNCVAQADVVVIATPWSEFSSLPTEAWARHSRERIVIDCWRVLNNLKECEGVEYIPLGVFGPLFATDF
ncbi:MAG: UDP-glucose/GDP-mannose dehydrogenase family protein [Thermofilaceae archaeon]